MNHPITIIIFMASHHLGTNKWPTNLRMWQLYEEAVALAAQLLPSTHALKLDAEKAGTRETNREDPS